MRWLGSSPVATLDERPLGRFDRAVFCVWSSHRPGSEAGLPSPLMTIPFHATSPKRRLSALILAGEGLVLSGLDLTDKSHQLRHLPLQNRVLGFHRGLSLLQFRVLLLHRRVAGFEFTVQALNGGEGNAVGIHRI